jgi:hypothetical protein
MRIVPLTVMKTTAKSGGTLAIQSHLAIVPPALRGVPSSVLLLPF